MPTTPASPPRLAPGAPWKRASSAVLGWFERHARAITIANLVGQGTLILTGGIVRLTGSGLGCTRAWYCEPGSLVPTDIRPGDVHPYIEFGNRTLAVLLAAVAASMAIAVWRTRPAVRWWALAPLALVVVQAVIGGLVVEHGLPPALVGLHLYLSVVLVWASMILVLAWREAPGIVSTALPRRAGLLRIARWASLALLAILVALGTLTTGTGPHSGDADVAQRLGFDPTVVARLHSASVWAFTAIVVAIALGLSRAARAQPSSAAMPAALTAYVWLIAAIVAQGALGYTVYFTGRAVGWVFLHMAGIAVLAALHSKAFYLSRPERLRAATADQVTVR